VRNVSALAPQIEAMQVGRRTAAVSWGAAPAPKPANAQGLFEAFPYMASPHNLAQRCAVAAEQESKAKRLEVIRFEWLPLMACWQQAVGCVSVCPR
jgi:hypothetical protein